MEADRGARHAEVTWFKDTGAWRLIALRFLPALGVLSLAWEVAHVRLYTLWDEAEAVYIAFSVAHCTLGDMLIGSSVLLLALILGREGSVPEWRWGRIAILTVLLGAGYTVFSEWLNLSVLQSWAYADSMPRLRLGQFELGVSPLLQWVVIPPLALRLARATIRRAA
jgi:hypothetical protein